MKALVVILILGYVLSVLFWSWVLMLSTGAAGLHWSYFWIATHWGLLTPLVTAMLIRSRT